LILGFFYALEFAQAVFLLALPMTLIGFLSLSTVRQIEDGALRDEALCKRLAKHRVATQMMDTVFIFVTALWGMYQNPSIGVC